MSLSGARVLVTGGASGIGRAMAEAFATQGASVGIADANPAMVGAFAKERPDIAGHVCEVAVDALFAGIDDLDVLCANAGTAGPTGNVEDIDYEAWKACIAVNLDGAFLCARRAAPLMKAKDAGSIILTSSTAGQFGYPGRAPYAAAKWGVIGLAKTLAMELGPHGIRANAICPGVVEGPRIDNVIAAEAKARGSDPEAIRESYRKSASLRTFIQAEDIAAMAVFLASPAGAKITGQALAVDGHTEYLTG